MSFFKKELQNFTRNDFVETRIYRPERLKEAGKLINDHENILPIGNLKSYSDSALNDEAVFKTERLNKFLFFDRLNGILEVQSGVTTEDIIKYILPKGWFLYSVPGTKYATIGGMVSSNTHGKNQFSSGSFAEHIISIKIVLANGEKVNASAQENAEIFNAVIAGYGLAGYVESVKIQLVKVKSSYAYRNIHKINYENTIQELKNYFDVKKVNNEFLIAWIDHFSVKENSAKIIFQTGNYANQGGFKVKNSDKKLLEFLIDKFSFLISFFVKPLFIRVFNNLVWLKTRNSKSRAHLLKFLFPLDFVKNWNKCYGKKGFLQYHFVLPDSEIVFEEVFEILNKLKSKKIYSYLITLKKYKKDKAGNLSFPIDGYGLAMDFPNTKKVRDFLGKEITEYILDKKGKVYLAKDSLLNKDQFHRMYEGLEAQLETLKKLGSNKKFGSKLADRLGLKDY